MVFTHHDSPCLSLGEGSYLLLTQTGNWLLQVQHAGLKDSCTADILTVECLVRLVDWFFPDFNYTWLVEEIKNTTPKVCDHTFGWPVST